MMKLGFIKDFSQSPPEFPKIMLRPVQNRLSTIMEATVNSWPDDAENQHFELALDVNPDFSKPEEWILSMAGIIKDLGWTEWWLDCGSVARVMNLGLTEALNIWGMQFWPNFALDGVVLLQVENRRQAVYQSVVFWHEKFPEVKFNSEYDFDIQERERIAAQKERTERMKAFFRPRSPFAKPKTT